MQAAERSVDGHSRDANPNGFGPAAGAAQESPCEEHDVGSSSAGSVLNSAAEPVGALARPASPSPAGASAVPPAAVADVRIDLSLALDDPGLPQTQQTLPRAQRLRPLAIYPGRPSQYVLQRAQSMVKNVGVGYSPLDRKRMLVLFLSRRRNDCWFSRLNLDLSRKIFDSAIPARFSVGAFIMLDMDARFPGLLPRFALPWHRSPSPSEHAVKGVNAGDCDRALTRVDSFLAWLRDRSDIINDVTEDMQPLVTLHQLDSVRDGQFVSQEVCSMLFEY